MASVCFRSFEPRDLDFIHQCKTDEKLNSMVVGNWKPFTKAQSKEWLDGCIRADNPAYKFWAIATNDEDKRIVGWLSLSNIDENNSSACFHGIVIGDNNYKDGLAWIESFLFVYNYVFIDRKLNRLYGSCLTINKASLYITEAMLEKVEGIARKAVYRNGQYYDVLYGAILREEYLNYLNNNEFEIKKILSRLLEARKTMKNRYNI